MLDNFGNTIILITKCIKFNEKFKYIIFSLVFILIINVLPLKAEILIRGGFLWQNLPTSEGYNKFIKQRYGTNSPQIYGSILSVSHKGEDSIWGGGLELDRIFGSFTYKTLNGENQVNKIKLQNTIAFFALFLGKSNNISKLIDLYYCHISLNIACFCKLMAQPPVRTLPSRPTLSTSTIKFLNSGGA